MKKLTVLISEKSLMITLVFFLLRYSILFAQFPAFPPNNVTNTTDSTANILDKLKAEIITEIEPDFIIEAEKGLGKAAVNYNIEWIVITRGQA